MKKLVITSGDPAGVGPEIIENALSKVPAFVNWVVVMGQADWVIRMNDEFGVEGVSVDSTIKVESGSPTVEGAHIALEAMRMAAEGTRNGAFSGVVTGPISKYWCQQAGMKHPGQTEFFADQWSGKPTMAFYSERMIVSLVTWHVPLMEVWKNLTPEAISRTITHTVEFLEKLGHKHPRIAVCGFNPHAGENGQIGREEIEVLNPLIASLRTVEYELSDCLPADTVFYRHMTGDFDAVIALYHDQALAPVKTVAFHDAVNVTLGLSHVRTSPDHGTAYTIAGKGKACPDSLIHAIKLALRLG